MKRSVRLTFFLALFSLICLVQAQSSDFDVTLSFEGTQTGKTPRGWGGSNDGTVFYDNKVVHSGKGAARLERNAQSPGDFSSLMQYLPIDFGGQTVELRGFLRTEDIDGFAGLWMRQDGKSGTLEFDNMQDRGVRGTTDWTEYRVELPLDPKADELYFGVLVAGKGKVWADDLELLVGGEPLSEAPERVVEKTVLDTDRAFDRGSGITTTSLTRNQIENLAVLGKVWGFLKYHHPRVATGELHWDNELFRVLPDVLKADSPAARNRVLSRWVARLGVPESCDPCASLPEDVHLRPRLAWLKDAKQLGPTSRQLQSVYQNRFAGDEQFYVSLAANVGNPIFDHELSYADQPLPDAGYRILSLLRYWNMIEYWFPYRNQIDGSWDAVLREFLPRIVNADTPDAYRLVLLALVTHIQDTHANLWSDLEVRPPRGACRWPVALRFVEGRATVTSLLRGKEQGGGLEIGDVFTQVDGQSVESLIKAWSPLYSASNQAKRLDDVAQNLPRGNCGESEVVVSRKGKLQTLTLERLSGLDDTPLPHDRPGKTFELLTSDVAYLKLSSVRTEDVSRYLSQAAGTQGIIIDIRNYPAEFVVFALGSHFVQKPTPFARFTLGDLSNPGTFTWTEPITLTPSSPPYKGNVVILVDESSLSQAEYTALAFRASPNAVVIGSTTAGADGNVSSVPLPGGVETLISGIGVFYPDKRPTQQVGIVPDIVAAPTLKGIREGRDEVLERALRYVLGPDVSDREIRRLAK